MVYLVVSGMDVLGLFDFDGVHERDLIKVDGNWRKVNTKGKAVAEYAPALNVLYVSGALKKVDNEDSKS